MKYPRYFTKDDELIKYWGDSDFKYIAKGNHIRYYENGQLIGDLKYESEEEAFKQIDHIFFRERKR